MIQGIRYVRERKGLNEFQTAYDLLRTKRGDCEDLVAYFVAWAKQQGYRATFGLEGQGKGLYHVVAYVRFAGKWWRYDPSRALGMK
jgi:transglutaminase-like putative cysteine protease